MLYQRGKNKTWWYRFRFGCRIVHESAKSTSKAVAREAERQRRRGLEAKWNKLEKRALPPTFERASRQWVESRVDRVSPRTFEEGSRALRHLTPALGPTLLCDIEAEDIASYQRKRRQDGVGNRTINMELEALRQIMRVHRLWDAIAPDVHILPERKDIARALSQDEKRLLLAFTAKTDSACHTSVVLALNTAMRRDEIRNLRWAQIDWEKRALTVGKSKTTAGTGRRIPLNPLALAALVKWASRFSGSKSTDYVFPWCENRQIVPERPTKGWRTAWRTALRRAGIRSRFHDLRVTCMTKLAESQASDMTIMAIAGHISRRMLEHYSRIRMDAKRKALDAIAEPPKSATFEGVVHQNGNQLEALNAAQEAKSLN